MGTGGKMLKIKKVFLDGHKYVPFEEDTYINAKSIDSISIRNVIAKISVRGREYLVFKEQALEIIAILEANNEMEI